MLKLVLQCADQSLTVSRPPPQALVVRQTCLLQRTNTTCVEDGSFGSCYEHCWLCRSLSSFGLQLVCICYCSCLALVQVDAEVGAPRVNYRETVTRRADFDYLHKKQSGGQGQYGRVVGYIEPLPEGSSEKFEYANEIVGNAIPPNYLPSCKKGFEEAVNSGNSCSCPCPVQAHDV